jgi:hypothetical protein
MFTNKSLLAATALLLGISGAALAQNAKNDNAPLVSIGVNVPACKGPNDQGGSFLGLNKGVVNVHYNAEQKRFQLNVAVHDALPNTTYDVDIRCWVFGPQHAVGSLTTNKQGTGTFQIDLWLEKVPEMANFYVDIAVPAQPNGPGAGGYGDTYIAGPFNVF